MKSEYIKRTLYLYRLKCFEKMNCELLKYFQLDMPETVNVGIDYTLCKI